MMTTTTSESVNPSTIPDTDELRTRSERAHEHITMGGIYHDAAVTTVRNAEDEADVQRVFDHLDAADAEFAAAEELLTGINEDLTQLLDAAETLLDTEEVLADAERDVTANSAASPDPYGGMPAGTTREHRPDPEERPEFGGVLGNDDGADRDGPRAGTLREFLAAKKRAEQGPPESLQLNGRSHARGTKEYERRKEQLKRRGRWDYDDK